MKTILVPTDGRLETDKALEVASVIAAKTGEKVQLLPVSGFINHNPFSDSSIQVPDTISHQTHVMQLTEEEEGGNSREVPARSEIIGRIEVNGEIKNVIDTTISKDVDLVVSSANFISGRHELSTDSISEGTKGTAQTIEIIMDAHAEGTKGASAAHEVPFVPVVAKAVKFAHCPVLILTQTDEKFEMNNVVLVTNFEDGSEPLFQSINKLQELFSFNLFLLHVNTWYNHELPDVLENKMKELANKHALNNYTFQILDDYTYEEGIIHFSQKVKADIIAMPIDKHKDISRLLSENLTKNTAQHQVKGLLIFNID